MNATMDRTKIVLAEDDDDDCLLVKRAFEAAHILNPVVRVQNGEELLAYLRRPELLRPEGKAREHCLVLLDLNMPRKDGREALREIREDPELKHLPIVVLTTSRAEEDVIRSYRLGVNAFMQKPVRFEGLVEALKVLGRYWFEIVELPPSSVSPMPVDQ